jgi:carbonic anhydrase
MREEIQKRNRAFLATKKALRPFEPTAQPRLLVVSCSCPELNGIAEEALGLSPGEAFFIRVAGAWGGRRGDELLRSVAVALEYIDFPTILVLGHEPCRCLEASTLQARRVLAPLAGDDDSVEGSVKDLGGWPALPSEAVAETVRRLRPLASAARGGEIWGAMMDLPSGRVRFLEADVEKPEEAREEAQAPAEIKVKVEPDDQSPGTDTDHPPMLQLPEILLPEIPDVPVLAPDPGPKEIPQKPREFAYGHVPGSGPVSLFAMPAESGPPSAKQTPATPPAKNKAPKPGPRQAQAVRGDAKTHPSLLQKPDVPESVKDGQTRTLDLLSVVPYIKKVIWQNLPFEHIQSMRRDVRAAIDSGRSSGDIVKTFVAGLAPLGQKRQLIRNELNFLSDVLAGAEEEFVSSIMEGLLD